MQVPTPEQPPVLPVDSPLPMHSKPELRAQCKCTLRERVTVAIYNNTADLLSTLTITSTQFPVSSGVVVLRPCAGTRQWPIVFRRSFEDLDAASNSRAVLLVKCRIMIK